jgi:gentisate 1,2-dioxygenase
MSTTLLQILPETLAQLKPDGPESYYEGLARSNYSPGWARLQQPLWTEPQRTFIPTVWRYKDAREALDRAGDYVPIDKTDRRNLIMVNPVEGNRYGSTRNLVAAYQMIKPGETARNHRHTPNALRLILDAKPDVFTVVDGVRVDMKPGDIVLTPNWRWHSHANNSDETAYWIDFLDIPLAQLVDGVFFEVDETPFCAPKDYPQTSPFRFSSSELLAKAPTHTDGDVACRGFAEGTMATIELSLESLPSSKATPLRQVVANNVYAVVSGSCRVSTDGDVLADDVGRGDVVSIPLWRAHRIEASADTVLLRVTDAPMYRALGLYRERTKSDEGTAM